MTKYVVIACYNIFIKIKESNFMGKFIDIPDWLKLDNILEEETDDEIKIELQK